MGDPYQCFKETLIRFLLVASNCINDAHEEVREIAKEAMEALEKRNAKR